MIKVQRDKCTHCKMDTFPPAASIPVLIDSATEENAQQRDTIARKKVHTTGDVPVEGIDDNGDSRRAHDLGGTALGCNVFAHKHWGYLCGPWIVDTPATHQPKEAGCGKIRHNEQNIHTLTHPVFI
jgi:hypothetical protein